MKATAPANEREEPRIRPIEKPLCPIFSVVRYLRQEAEAVRPDLCGGYGAIRISISTSQIDVANHHSEV